jgi:hypothetical protein
MTCVRKFGKETQQEAIKAYKVLGTLKLGNIYQLNV